LWLWLWLRFCGCEFCGCEFCGSVVSFVVVSFASDELLVWEIDAFRSDLFLYLDGLSGVIRSGVNYHYVF
jgi:hypothetical protein